MKRILALVGLLIGLHAWAQPADQKTEMLHALQAFAKTNEYQEFLAAVSPNSAPMQLKLDGVIAFYVLAKDGVTMHDKHQAYPFFKYETQGLKLSGKNGKWIIDLMGQSGNRHAIVMIKTNGVWELRKYTP